MVHQVSRSVELHWHISRECRCRGAPSRAVTCELRRGSCVQDGAGATLSGLPSNGVGHSHLGAHRVGLVRLLVQGRVRDACMRNTPCMKGLTPESCVSIYEGKTSVNTCAWPSESLDRIRTLTLLVLQTQEAQNERPNTRVCSKDLHPSALQLFIQGLGRHDEVNLRCAVHLHVAVGLILAPAQGTTSYLG